MSSELSGRALLPPGLQDLLFPDAAIEAAAIETLIGVLEGQGYERVKPPLLEFEESLFAGAGSAVAESTFRLLDPISRRMMGLRADITPQIARIAASRLAATPRPLRLCYAGQVLRIGGSQLRPERQFAQVGAELIGSAAQASDAEAILLAAEALQALGIAGLTVDLNLPTLVDAIGGETGLAAERLAPLKAALDRKDAAAVTELVGSGESLYHALMAAALPAPQALERLRALALPPAAAREVALLEELLALLAPRAEGLAITVDPVEHRGFEYQSGLSFTLFAPAARGELGRGGRYTIAGAEETATGFTLFMDTVLRAAPRPGAAPRLFLPWGHAPATAAALRGEGWRTLAALAPDGDAEAEARRLGCSHILGDEGPRPLAPQRGD